MQKVDVTEYSRFEILTAIVSGWKAVTSQEIPQYLLSKVYELIEKLDNLLARFHLNEVTQLAFNEGVIIAKEQLT